jgi:hypothetical protein
MNPRSLQNNRELFEYLVWLSEELRSKGRTDVAEAVRIASRFLSGSASEFLHESQGALEHARDNCASQLTPSQLADIVSVIEQIEVAFKKVGGA